MKKQIACFGVRDYEIPYFEELGKKYDYDLVLFPQFLPKTIKTLIVMRW